MPQPRLTALAKTFQAAMIKKARYRIQREQIRPTNNANHVDECFFWGLGWQSDERKTGLGRIEGRKRERPEASGFTDEAQFSIGARPQLTRTKQL